MSTMNGGNGGVLILPGQGGGVSGAETTKRPAQPDFQSILSGSELAILFSLIQRFLDTNPGSAASPEQIAAAVTVYIDGHPEHFTNLISTYLAANPQGRTEEQVLAAINARLGVFDFTPAATAAVEEYFILHPPVDTQAVNTAIQTYLTSHPQGKTEAEINAIISSYLIANPPSSGTVSPAEIEAAVNSYLARNPVASDRKFNSWSSLANTKPTATGERVYLNDYYGTAGWAARALSGGGWFIGNVVTAANWKAADKGFIASIDTDKTFFWRRELPMDDLNIMHFGAVGDGVTDDSPAVMAMFRFFRTAQTAVMNPEASMMPIKFPAGKFMVKPMDFTQEGSVTSAADLKLARQKVVWRENGLQRGQLGGSGTGVGTNGANAAAYSNVDLDYVKSNKPALYLDYSAQENHNGYNAIGYFGLTGAKVHYGRGIQTVIVSDNTADSYVFEVRSIRCEMHGIQFEGGAGTSGQVKDYGVNGPKPGVTAKTNQGFFKNWRSEGQYYDVSCMRMLMVGGRSFDMVDTLDAKFDQCYSELCWGSVLYSGWSNAVVGAWDHGTALEICNSHFVTSLLIDPPIYMPRCAQSMIRNVWIESCVTPAVLHDSALTLDTFCVEACDNPVYALNSRDVLTVYSAPTGVKFDISTTPYLVVPALNDDQATWQINPNWKAPIAMADRAVYAKYNSLYTRPKGSPIREWLSAYERGQVIIDNNGIDTQGVITTGVIQSGTISNPYPEDRWVCLGMIELRGRSGLTQEQIRTRYAAAGKTESEITAALAANDYGPGVEIEINNSRATGTYDEKSALLNRQSGKTVIRRKQSANFGPGDAHSYWHEGDTIIKDVGASGWGNTKIWLKLPANSGELSFVIKGGGVSRKNGSGTCTRFEPGRGETTAIDTTTGGFAKDADGNAITDAGNRLTDMTVFRKQWNVNVGNAGIGLTNAGTIAMKTVTPDAGNLPTTIELAKVGVWQTVSVDNVDYYMPLFKRNGT